ncbi:MAG: hypothetical protein WCA39_05600 [Nitrososphaeraceae archaeon]
MRQTTYWRTTYGSEASFILHRFLVGIAGTLQLGILKTILAIPTTASPSPASVATDGTEDAFRYR